MPEFKSKFKPGDVVRCTRISGGAIVGELYKVHKVRHREDHNCTYVYFSETDYLKYAGNDEDGFELVKPADNPFKVGDKVMLEDWEKFYEILEVKGDEIKLQSSSGNYYWYSTTRDDFEKESTMKFDPNKKYRMVDTHEPVRIICTDRKDNFVPYVGLCLNTEGYENVIFLVEHDERIEEVPQVDWNKVEVDTLIWVYGRPRYFQSYNRQKDQVYFWDKGTTSVTNTTGTTWDFSDGCSLEKPNA
jgi:hypothetical protein